MLSAAHVGINRLSLHTEKQNRNLGTVLSDTNGTDCYVIEWYRYSSIDNSSKSLKNPSLNSF